MTSRPAARRAPRLARARRIVVKVGSALLVDAATGRLNRAWLDSLAQDIAAMRERGQQLIVVSSGAIALGRRLAGLGTGRLRLDESQAAAAVGQIRLAHCWKEAMDAHGVAVAQLLLTLGDTEQRRRYLNARSTFNTLLKLGVLPVVNENDTVATAEIRYGDNDRLAARIAQMVSADCLVLLSDVDGLYDADPSRNPGARHLSRVDGITPAVMAMAAGPASEVGTGGMATKLEAARIAVAAGCQLCIASGTVRHPLKAVEEGARCTWFLAQANPLTVRKQWIAGSLSPAGAVQVDDGAARALAAGKSLLPAGVTAVQGQFGRGDAVRVVDAGGRELARGLAAYASDEIRRICGRRSPELAGILGYRGRDEVIHRDDLVATRHDGKGHGRG